MTTLSSPACILSTVPHASRQRTPGSRRYTQRRGSFKVTMRRSYAEGGAFESAGNGQELQNSSLVSTPPDGHWNDHPQQELGSREQQLWQRQEALWQQQLAHWQHERSMFAQREQALMAHIQQLHSHLIAVTTQHTQSKQPGGTGSSGVAQDSVMADSSTTTAEMLQMLADGATSDQQAVADQQAIGSSTSMLDSVSPQHSASVPSVAQPAASRAAPAAPESQGPPPHLSLGSDDIYWVHQLQSVLMNEGYYCGEEEMEDFIFESGTESAVLAFQACAGVEESGVADEATWRALLGDKFKPASPPIDEEILEETAGLDGPLLTPAPPSTPRRHSEAKDANPWEASWGDLLSSQESDTEFDQDSSQSSSFGGGMAAPALQASADVQAATDAQTEATGTTSQWKPYVNEDTDYTRWTVLREGDGGRHVHELQVALVQQGFWPGEDDMQWWQFGDATCSAVQTFQASVNLPESGVVTSDTWQALLGKDAKPIDAKSLALNDETDDDMTAEHEGMVYLIGEQRWERRSQPSL
ncbi:hypothetical protein ABBQ32_006019 [Trebouxia sp. C0010 RCD-2024]